MSAGSGPTPGRLPAGYTELAYIEGTGTQYIDTGKVFNSNYKYQFKFKRNNSLTTQIAGYVTSDQYCRFGVSGSNNALYYATASSTASLSLGARNTDDHEIVFNPTNRLLTYDGVAKWNNSWITTEFISEINFYLFADSSHTSGRILSGRFYYYQVYNGDTLVQDLVPAMHDSDSVVGLYDLVSNTFLTNSGSGAFNYGTL